jgi:hypothetical protein
LIIEKHDYYDQLDEHKTKGHTIYDSLGKHTAETSEIYDYIPSYSSRSYICLANSLSDGKLIGKTKLLINKIGGLPLIIKYIYIEKSEKPIELYEYHPEDESKIIFKIVSGNYKPNRKKP